MTEWSDTRFRASLAAGPLCWLLLWAWLRPHTDPSWPLREAGTFLGLVLLVPAIEELVFRGAVQGTLRRFEVGRRSVAGLSLANVTANAAFAAAHCALHAPPWALLVALPGLAFGYFRDRYDSVRPGLVLHGFYNLGYFWIWGDQGVR